jgi:hypothetical protein
MADFLTYEPDVVDSRYMYYMFFCCIKQHKPDETSLYDGSKHVQQMIDHVEDYNRSMARDNGHRCGVMVKEDNANDSQTRK